MQPDEALIARNVTLSNYDFETPVTRKVIAAIPAGKEDYAPDPKSMNALKLAWHIASADVWFLTCVAQGKFARGESPDVPASIKSGADVVAWHEAAFPDALARVKAMSGEELARPLDFFGMFSFPAVWFLSLNQRHVIHHRGQLSAYLRPMGGKVPSIYGPSGDEQIT